MKTIEDALIAGVRACQRHDENVANRPRHEYYAPDSTLLRDLLQREADRMDREARERVAKATDAHRRGGGW